MSNKNRLNNHNIELQDLINAYGGQIPQTYGVPVETVEEFSFKGRQTRADELERIKSRAEILAVFGAVKVWKSGDK
jgi:hypothetical protein